MRICAEIHGKCASRINSYLLATAEEMKDEAFGLAF